MVRALSTLYERAKREQGGFTLVELLLASSLGTLLISAALLFLDIGIGAQHSTTKATDALSQQRVGLERMTREIRQATSLTLLNSQAIELTMYVPGSRAQQRRRVVYDCSTGEVCRRSSGPVGEPFTSTDIEIVSVVQNVDVFDPQPDINPSFVAIAVRVRVKGGADDPTKVITIRDGVALRNSAQ